MFRALRRPRALCVSVFSDAHSLAAPLSVAPRFSSSSSASASAPASPAQPEPSAVPVTSVFASRVRYESAYTTDRANPAAHDFSDAGLYMSLGDDASVSSAFPGGLAGDFDVEFKVAGANALFVRPVGVSLVAHLEHWRHERGRALAATGAAVLDIDASAPYAPTPLALPMSRAALAADGTGASASGSGAGAGAADSASSENERGVSRSSFPRAPFDAASGVSPRDVPFRPARVLVGPRGIGKSGVLNYVVHYARQNDWVTVFVPDAFAVANLGLVLAPSRLRPGFIDQHDCALAVLRDVQAANGDRLARIPQRLAHAKHRYLPEALDVVVSRERAALRTAEEVEVARLKAVAEAAGKPWDPTSFSSKYEDETDTGVDRSSFTLADLVSWGLRHPAALADTLLALLAELRVTTEFPVLVAVDGINHFYTQGPYANAGGKIPPSALSMQAAFACFDEKGFRESFTMKRGVWLSAVSMKHSEDMEPMFGSVNVRDRYRVHVPPLTRQELHATLLHYTKSNNFFMLQRASIRTGVRPRAHSTRNPTPDPSAHAPTPSPRRQPRARRAI